MWAFVRRSKRTLEVDRNTHGISSVSINISIRGIGCCLQRPNNSRQGRAASKEHAGDTLQENGIGSHEERGWFRAADEISGDDKATKDGNLRFGVGIRLVAVVGQLKPES